MSDERGPKMLADVLGAIDAGGARPNWCPGALVRNGDGTRRMPCDRPTEPNSGRCKACAELERRDRAARREQSAPKLKSARKFTP